MSFTRAFERRIDSLSAIFAFTRDAFASASIDPALLLVVDFAIEELFTNMVKYGGGSRCEVRIELAPIARGVEVTMTDYDVDPFDVTRAPDADVSLPAEERRPGGLGLYLVRRLVDSLAYEYSAERRESRITFTKTGLAPTASAGDATTGGHDARD